MQSTRTYMFRPIACSLIRVAVTAKAGKAVLAVSWDVLHSKIDSVAYIYVYEHNVIKLEPHVSKNGRCSSHPEGSWWSAADPAIESCCIPSGYSRGTKCR